MRTKDPWLGEGGKSLMQLFSPNKEGRWREHLHDCWNANSKKRMFLALLFWAFSSYISSSPESTVFEWMHVHWKRIETRASFSSFHGQWHCSWPHPRTYIWLSNPWSDRRPVPTFPPMGSSNQAGGARPNTFGNTFLQISFYKLISFLKWITGERHKIYYFSHKLPRDS